MNCQEFEHIVHDLARDAAPQAETVSLWHDGLSHAEACDQCSALFAEVRALHANLHRLAASDRERTAPLRIESVLLNAFRQNQSEIQRPSRHWKERTGFAILAAAAVIILAIAVGFGLHRGISIPGWLDHSSSNATARGSSDTNSGDQGTPTQIAAVAPETDSGAALSQSESDGEEGFVTLPEASYLPPVEAGAVVRVTMTSSSLASLGLPVVAGSENGQIAADLLVDQMGTPRAIRFVH